MRSCIYLEVRIIELKLQSNKIFEPLHKSKCRYIVCKGSAGSGKSVDAAQQYIIRLLTEPGRNLVCIRKIEGANRNSTFAELKGCINRLGLASYFDITESLMSVTCKSNRNKIVFGGVNDEHQREKLKSITFENGKLTDIWIEESTELTQPDFEIIDDRLRGQLPNGLFYQIKLTFNPVSALHWIKKYFFDRLDINTLTHHSTYKDNKFIDQAYYERMERRKEIDPEGYRIYGEGEWGETEGIIFPAWQIATCEQDLSHYDDVMIGQDFGFNHANAILLLGAKDGNVYILKELYENGKDTAELIELAEGIFPKDKMMICDSAEPDRIKMWRKVGYKAMPCIKGANSVKAQIDWLKQRTIYIDSDCINTIAEIGQYRWKFDNVTSTYTDEPINFFDDAMAALRYGVQQWRLQSRIGKEKPKEQPTYPFKALQPKQDRVIGKELRPPIIKRR